MPARISPLTEDSANAGQVVVILGEPAEAVVGHLASRYPVWLLGTPVNAETARLCLAADTPARPPQPFGAFTFEPGGKAPAEMLDGALDGVETHHAPPWEVDNQVTEVLTRGIYAHAEVIAVLQRWDYTVFTSTPSGLLARREVEASRHEP